MAAATRYIEIRRNGDSPRINRRDLVVRVSVRCTLEDRQFDRARMREAINAALALGGVKEGRVNVLVVDDPTIHEMNRRHLNHDYPTDVLSFLMEERGRSIEGDIVASIDTAERMAPQYGWSAQDELLLYVVHGSLHLVGFDDLDPKSQSEMRDAERKVLGQFGLTVRHSE
jgi:probable rRNA maturation factor